jgi:uncharacterized RDD family membrane protein YckC
MRCPKCHYLSFDPEPRCRNCGYDLEVADAELALRTSDPADEPLPDLTLRERPAAASGPVALDLTHAATAVPAAGLAEASSLRIVLDDDEPAGAGIGVGSSEADADREFQIYGDLETGGEAAPVALATVPDRTPQAASEPEPEPRVAAFRAPHTTTEMPLFVKALADREESVSAGPVARMPPPEEGPVDRPVVVPPTRPPLAVRRPAPEPVRARSRPAERRLGPLDHDLLEDLKRVEREEAARAREEARTAARAMEMEEAGDRVEPSRRAAAAALDAAVLGGIAAFVLWATLKLCNVGLFDLGPAAFVPLLVFLAAVDLTYLLMFTAAGGQTVGKMMMGLRVVEDAGGIDAPVPLRRAAWRAVLAVVSVAGLGLGWLPALFGRGLTLHDRIAHTRVVRA